MTIVGVFIPIMRPSSEHTEREAVAISAITGVFSGSRLLISPIFNIDSRNVVLLRSYDKRKEHY